MLVIDQFNKSKIHTHYKLFQYVIEIDELRLEVPNLHYNVFWHFIEKLKKKNLRVEIGVMMTIVTNYN